MRRTFRSLAEANPDRYLVLDARLSPDEIAAAIRVRVAELLSGLPLQTLAQTEPVHTNGTPVPHNGLAPHHPHAQTGATPQLHP